MTQNEKAIKEKELKESISRIDRLISDYSDLKSVHEFQLANY